MSEEGAALIIHTEWNGLVAQRHDVIGRLTDQPDCRRDEWNGDGVRREGQAPNGVAAEPGKPAGTLVAEGVLGRRERELGPLLIEGEQKIGVVMSGPGPDRRARMRSSSGDVMHETLCSIAIQFVETVHGLFGHPSDQDAKLERRRDERPWPCLSTARRRIDV